MVNDVHVSLERVLPSVRYGIVWCGMVRGGVQVPRGRAMGNRDNTTTATTRESQRKKKPTACDSTQLRLLRAEQRYVDALGLRNDIVSVGCGK